jgi:hypothetical protein
MIRKGVEFTVQLIEPGLWKWRFQIGEAVTDGRTPHKTHGPGHPQSRIRD